jgi:uncharacterized protein (DUF849 family)
MPALLEAAMNGDRTRQEHPAVPRTPQELAADGLACARAGARVLHLHPYDGEGRQTLDAEPCAAALRAVRAVCPGVAISLSTSAAIEADPERRAHLVAGWTELPELVTANQGESGIVALCHALLERGVGIEAGLLELADAHAFVASGLAPRCTRVLMEPLDADPDAAVAHAAAMDEVVTSAGIELEQVQHGDGLASWAVTERALARGHGTRAGIEDCPLLPNGSRARDNAELVAHAAQLIGLV